MSRAISVNRLPKALQLRLTGGAGRAKPRGKKPQMLRKAQREAIRVQFRLLCKGSGLPMPSVETRFHPTRLWRWDYSWEPEKVALEVDGGIFTSGAHVRGARILKTHEKLSTAAALGWRVLYCVPKNLCTDATIELVRQALSPQPPSQPSP